MAKKKANSTTAIDAVVAAYQPTDEAIKSPRMIRLSKDSHWIGVGGEIKIPANPPYQP